MASLPALSGPGVSFSPSPVPPPSPFSLMLLILQSLHFSLPLPPDPSNSPSPDPHVPLAHKLVPTLQPLRGSQPQPGPCGAAVPPNPSKARPLRPPFPQGHEGDSGHLRGPVLDPHTPDCSQDHPPSKHTGGGEEGAWDLCRAGSAPTGCPTPCKFQGLRHSCTMSPGHLWPEKQLHLLAGLSRRSPTHPGPGDCAQTCLRGKLGFADS